MRAGGRIVRKASAARGVVAACLLALAGAALPATGETVRHGGVDYVALEHVGERLGMRAYWLRGYAIFRLRSQWTTIDAEKDSRILRINRRRVFMGHPTHLSDGALFIARADHRHAIRPILTPQIFGAPPRARRVVLDPGHGGRDSGARAERFGLKEKTLNLDVARRLAKRLDRLGFGVRMTRREDRYVSLAQRPRFANLKGGDLFVSLHFNAAASPEAAGVETYVLTPRFQSSSNYPGAGGANAREWPGNALDPWNTLAGYHVQDALVRATGGPDRGLKRARFAVLKPLRCPGLLVELGFLSHAPTARSLRSPAYREMLARALAEGIVAYRARLARID